MQLTDTHCHIHFSDYPLDPDEVIATALQNSVTQFLCVGCTLEDSQAAVGFVQPRSQCWAAVGLHPHEAHNYVCDAPACLAAKQPGKPLHKHNVLLEQFAELAKKPKVVAVGECGLDYHYNHSPKNNQRAIFEFQLDLAQKTGLPLIFHVREAFDDFFAILDRFEGVRGVVHSFTADITTLDKCLDRGLYIGLNGIMTFTNDQAQLDAAKAVPLNRLLLETDAPFLTPKPYRGTICQPKHLAVTAEFLSKLRGESMGDLANATTTNAKALFKL